ncbi:nucleotidyltransferase [Candidatus Woesearchaeota archaeon]|nr:nucleotidyltransferase [Candidatus Woesearchaeota archaeon]
MNELDKFVIRFIKILEKHVDYVIVSGYVSILFGRARATEDIDVFIKEIDKEKFKILYAELIKQNYWCLNSGDINEIYSYLEDGLAVRFSIENEPIPNFEIKFAKNKLSQKAFSDKITVMTPLGEIQISSIERQIAFKKYYLKSDKDIEDAKHLEELFKENINIKKIEKYKSLIENGKA